MGALLWSYLGWRRFPRELSGFELRRFFALEASDRRELRVRYPRRLRLGAAIQLGFVRMTGTTLDALDYVPKSLLEYVAHQLMLPAPELATLRALYRNERTRFAHQAWACAHAGLRWPEHTDVAAVGETLTAAAAVTLDRHRLARQAREALFARDCLIPAGRDSDDWVRRAVREVERSDRERLDAVVPASVRERWLPQLMREVGVGPTTVLEWLRRPPRRRSTKTLGEELAKLSALRALSPHRPSRWGSHQSGCGRTPGACVAAARSRCAPSPSRGARSRSPHCSPCSRHARATRCCA